ncbi:MAG: GNAT family N-acetyltransferase [Terriglobales bacterium]|jgi:RimJ/RimL family protein N-acetyltransferase
MPKETIATQKSDHENIVVVTQRLRLRHLQLEDDDVAALHAVLGDPEAMKYYPAPFTRVGSTEWIRKQLARYEADGFGLWAVVLKSSGQVIGDCGLIRQQVNAHDEVELAYHIRRDCQRMGYATEAARPCLQLAHERFRMARLISMIRPENLASRRVAEKCGLHAETELNWRGYPHLVYRINLDPGHSLLSPSSAATL